MNVYEATEVRVVNFYLSKVLGLNEALFLGQLWYWMKRSQHTIEGKRWVYKTYEQWMEELPWWSRSKLIRIVKGLEAKGVIFAGEFNKSTVDRTKWYTINLDHPSARMEDHSVKMTSSGEGQNDLLHQSVKMTCSDHEITQEITQESTDVSPKAKTVDAIAAEQGLGKPDGANGFDFDEAYALGRITELPEHGTVISIWWRECMRGYGHVSHTLPELTQKDQKQLKTLIKQLGPDGPLRIMLALKHWTAYKKYANDEFGLKSTVKPVIQKFVLGRNAIAGFEAPADVDFAEKEWKTL